MNLDLYHTPYTKINEKCITELNVKGKTLKPLGENNWKILVTLSLAKIS